VGVKWWLKDVVIMLMGMGVLMLLSAGLQRIPVAGMPYYFRIIILIGINIILAVSLNIINGHAGQFSMGHAGFMAIGAYMSAILTYYYFAPYVSRYAEGPGRTLIQNLLFLVALLFGGVCAALAGYLVGVPSLRLRGDYLGIVTLGFGEIIRVMFLNVEKVGAARGFSGVPAWSNFFWVFFVAWVTIIISSRLVNSSIGRAFLAVREDEIAAEAMGVSTTYYKVQAFVVGSFFAGVAGALYGHYLAYLNPEMFNFIKSFEVIVMVVLGGMGSISGAVIAAAILTFLPEGLRPVKDWLNTPVDPRMVVYAIMLIVLMRVRPQGLLGRREVWEVMPRRKDVVPQEAAEGAGPSITGVGESRDQSTKK